MRLPTTATRWRTFSADLSSPKIEPRPTHATSRTAGATPRPSRKSSKETSRSSSPCSSSGRPGSIRAAAARRATRKFSKPGTSSAETGSRCKCRRPSRSQASGSVNGQGSDAVSPYRASSACTSACEGSIHVPPISRLSPSRASRLYQVRPPRRSRASTRRTLRPLSASSRAAITPASPPPMTMTSCATVAGR